MVELFAYSGDFDHTRRSDLGLHCLQITRLGVSSLKWVKKKDVFFFFFIIFIILIKHVHFFTKN